MLFWAWWQIRLNFLLIYKFPSHSSNGAHVCSSISEKHIYINETFWEMVFCDSIHLYAPKAASTKWISGYFPHAHTGAYIQFEDAFYIITSLSLAFTKRIISHAVCIHSIWGSLTIALHVYYCCILNKFTSCLGWVASFSIDHHLSSSLSNSAPLNPLHFFWSLAPLSILHRCIRKFLKKICPDNRCKCRLRC